MTGRHRSYWVKSAPSREFPALTGDAECDVAVIGAGIVGLTAALKLSREGVRVTLLEARSIGSGATGYTTGKLSSLNGLVYKRLSTSFGEDTARAYGEANEAGLEAISDYVEQYGIDCDFRRKANYTYSESDQGGANLAQEVDVATQIGLKASLVRRGERASLSVVAAVRFTDQAEFHALKYLYGLAGAATEAGCGFAEQTRVVDIGQGDPCRIETETGVTVRAPWRSWPPICRSSAGACTLLAPILSAPTPFSSAFATRCRRACI